MQPIYEISGEAGKGIDALARPLSALEITGGNFLQNGLDGDELTWQQPLARVGTLTPSGASLPTPDQVVELFAGGTKIFRGHVSRVQTSFEEGGASNFNGNIRVSGPDWWMSRISLTDALTEDQAGNRSERPVFFFQSSDVGAMIRDLITRSVALGVPISADTSGIQDCYLVPRLSFASADLWSTLIELIRWVPDALFFYDYSGALPRARLVRRAQAPVANYRVGELPLVGANLVPRIEKMVEEVRLDYAERDPSGRMVWRVQQDGVASNNNARQVVPISGPENDTFLPIDLVDSEDLQTVDQEIEWPFVVDRDRAVQEAGSPTLLMTPFRIVLRNTQTSSAAGSSNTITFIPGPTAVGNNNEDVTGMSILTAGRITDWIRTQRGIQAIDGVVRGRAILNHVRLIYSTATANPPPQSFPEPDFVEQLGMTLEADGFDGQNSSARFREIYSYQFEIPVVFVNASFPELTTVFREAEYGFIFPPDGLAQNLRAAQAWLPFDGQLQLASLGEILPTNVIGHKVRIQGGLPEWEQMDALTTGVEIDLGTGRATHSLGAPSRLDFQQLARTFSQAGRDNIELI